jgi:hypothetical protein
MKAMRSPLALALALALAACGGTDADKPVSGPDQAKLDEARKQCAAEPPSAKACDTLCARGEETACETLKNACLIGGDGEACFVLGRAYEREGDRTHAAGAYRLACQGGQSAACESLGESSTTIDEGPPEAPTPAPAPAPK